MGQTKAIEIRCGDCSKWFPSPIGLGDTQVFDASTLIGNQAQCPKCGKMTSCNKENMRVQFADGGFIGSQT